MKVIETVIGWLRRVTSTIFPATPQETPPLIEQESQAPEQLKSSDAPEHDKFALEGLWSARTTDRSILLGKNEARERLRAFYAEGNYAGNSGGEALLPYVAEVNNALVFPGSRLIVTERGVGLSDEMDLVFRKAAAQPKRNGFAMMVRAGPTVELDLPSRDIPSIDEGIHLTCEHEHNYFHWIIEILPRLFALEKLIPEKKIPLLISDGLHENLYSLLDVIRDPARPVIKLQREKAYRVRRLTFPGDVSRIIDDSVSVVPGELDCLPLGLLQGLAVLIQQKFATEVGSRSKKLYLIRNRKYRIPSNQNDVISCLESLGFTPTDTGQMSLKEQVQLFHDAEMIVAPSGASCTNMLWAPKGARMIVLHADHPRLTFEYWDALAKASGVEVSYLAGRRKHTRENIHDDFFIDTSALKEVVLR